MSDAAKDGAANATNTTNATNNIALLMILLASYLMHAIMLDRMWFALHWLPLRKVLPRLASPPLFKAVRR